MDILPEHAQMIEKLNEEFSDIQEQHINIINTISMKLFEKVKECEDLNFECCNNPYSLVDGELDGGMHGQLSTFESYDFGYYLKRKYSKSLSHQNKINIINNLIQMIKTFNNNIDVEKAKIHNLSGWELSDGLRYIYYDSYYIGEHGIKFITRFVEINPPDIEDKDDYWIYYKYHRLICPKENKTLKNCGCEICSHIRDRALKYDDDTGSGLKERLNDAEKEFNNFIKNRQ